MYLKHFKLNEEPFGSTHDPRFLYRSDIHQDALDRLVTSVSMMRGINAIIGEPGLGKSLLIRTLVSGLNKSVNFAWVFNTTLNSRELIKYICRDFGFTPKGDDLSDLLLELYSFLIKEYEAGKTNVLIVDEAQNLKPSVLEEIRQLSNIETTKRKLLQVILSGQPQLDVHLDHPALHQLKQRITFKAILKRLKLQDTKQYILHRLQVAGAKRNDIFTEKAMEAVYKISDGVPRLINQICDNALMVAAKRKMKQIDSVLVIELVEKSIVTPASLTPDLSKLAQYQAQKKIVLRKKTFIKKSANPVMQNKPKAFEDISLKDSLESFSALNLGELAIN